MFTSFDLLIVVSLGLIAASLVAVVLMFLVKNPKVFRVFLWITAALGVYMGTVGVRILWPEFLGQATLAVVLALASVGAFVLERVRRDDPTALLIARIVAAVALLLGICNALLW